MTTDRTCSAVREAVSARRDGEDPSMEWALVEAHLRGCASCRTFASSLDRTPGLADWVTAAAAHRDRSGVWWALRALLGAVAVGYLATAVPEVLLSNDPHHGHLAHHLGIFEAAYGVMLLFVAVRPARARAVVPLTVVLAVGMVVFAVTDVANGETPALAEMSHLLEIAGLVLVWLLATRRGWPGREHTSRPQGAPTREPASPAVRLVPPDGADGPVQRAG